MPQVSQKGLGLPASPIRKLVPFADAAKARGVHVYHLNIGQPDIETPPVFWDALKNIDDKVLSYCPSDGYAEYKAQFSKYYNRLGIQVTPNNFIITTGASEALSFGMMSCIDNGDEVIIPEPLYANYISFAKAGGIKIKPITTYIDNNFALPPIADFERQITDKTKAILVCNPNNPTGYMYTREELETLKKIVLKHNLFLFVDEVYREFAYDGQKHTSVLELDGLDENVVVFDSISKRFSACGARVGALVTRNQQVMECAMKFAQARLSPPSLAQMAGAKLFDLDADFYNGVVGEYETRRNILLEALKDIDGVVVPHPGGAFYACVELPVDNSDKFCQWLLESFDYNGKTVMMAPGSGFYSSDLGQNQVRIAYVLNQESLKEAIQILKMALQEYPGKTN